MLYVPRHFTAEELVYPGFFDANQHRGSMIFMAFDHLLLVTADRLRGRYGPMTVNDWAWGGSYQLSGLRPMNTGTGSALSQHKFGRALDLKPRDVTAAEIRADMRKHPDLPWFEFILRVETGVSWLHIDRGNHHRRDAEGIRFFQP